MLAALSKLNLRGSDLGIWASSQDQAKAWATKMVLGGTSPEAGLAAQLSPISALHKPGKFVGFVL